MLRVSWIQLQKIQSEPSIQVKAIINNLSVKFAIKGYPHFIYVLSPMDSGVLTKIVVNRDFPEIVSKLRDKWLVIKELSAKILSGEVLVICNNHDFTCQGA